MPKHNPIHHSNPCRYGEPAKIWEFLRRNKAFVKVVNDCLHEIELGGNSCDVSCVKHREHVYETLANVKREHPVYEIILKWMLSETTFQYCKANGDTGEGTEPNVSNMTWHPGEGIDGSGWLMRLGPTIRTYDGGTNMFAEWAAHMKGCGQPSLDAAWTKLPAILQREIESHWAHYRFEENGPRETVPMETDFFNHNLKHLFELDPSTGLDEEGLAIMYQFNETKKLPCLLLP